MTFCFMFVVVFNSLQFFQRLYLHRKSLFAMKRLHHFTVKWKETQHLQFLGVLVMNKVLSVMNNTWIFQKCRLHVPTTPVQQPMPWAEIQQPRFFVSGHFFILVVLWSGNLFFKSWALLLYLNWIRIHTVYFWYTWTVSWKTDNVT